MGIWRSEILKLNRRRRRQELSLTLIGPPDRRAEAFSVAGHNGGRDSLLRVPSNVDARKQRCGIPDVFALRGRAIPDAPHSTPGRAGAPPYRVPVSASSIVPLNLGGSSSWIPKLASYNAAILSISSSVSSGHSELAANSASCFSS